MVVRSRPSVSQSSLVPTTTTTASASRRGRDRAVEQVVGGAGSRSPASCPAGRSRSRSTNSTTRSTGVAGDELDRRLDLGAARRRRTASPGPGGSAMPSSTTTPSSSTRARPADLDERDAVRSGLRRRVAPGGAEREVVEVDAGRRGVDQQQSGRRGSVRVGDRHARELASGEVVDRELDVDGRRGLVEVEPRARSGRRRRHRTRRGARRAG